MRRNWKFKVKIKDLLDDDPHPPHEVIADKAREVSRRLKARRGVLSTLPAEDELENIIFLFDDAVDEATYSGEPLEAFNYALEALYDYGDANDVWIG